MHHGRHDSVTSNEKYDCFFHWLKKTDHWQCSDNLTDSSLDIVYKAHKWFLVIQLYQALVTPQVLPFDENVSSTFASILKTEPLVS